MCLSKIAIPRVTFSTLPGQVGKIFFLVEEDIDFIFEEGNHCDITLGGIQNINTCGGSLDKLTEHSSGEVKVP